MSTLIIEPGKSERHYWRDLWRYRDLFYFLAWRDVLVRYKQTVIGAAWAIIRPFTTMVIFTVIFGRIAQFPSEGVPYAILVFAGMLPWQFFASALGDAGGSLVSSSHLISKVYFPRLIIPASSMIVSFVDFAIASSILAALMIWYQFVPDWKILTLPLFVAAAAMAALGPGLWVTALTVKYRDFRFITPFVIQLGLYVSPVGFSSSMVQARFGDLAYQIYYLNPMVGVIDGFRWAILGAGHTLNVPGFCLSLLVSGALLWSGIWYFRKTERRFADVI